MRPEDLFPSGPDTVDVEGTVVRKGSVGSFIYNALTLESADPDSEEYTRAVADMREVVPVLRAVRVFDVFELRSERVAAVVREADPELLSDPAA